MKKIVNIKMIGVVLLLIIFATMELFSQAGTLDVSFNSVGRRTVNFGVGAEYSTAMAIQSDGKIVLVGHLTPTGTDIYVARVNTNGTLDATFDTDGMRIIDIGSGDLATGVAIQTDGKIVISFEVTNTDKDFAVMRLNTDGSDDGTFGTSGVTQVVRADDQSPTGGLAIATDGSIYIGGNESNTLTNGDFCVMKFDASGVLDNSFDSDGIAINDFCGLGESINGIAILPNGRIVTVGYSLCGTDNEVAIAIYNTDGSLYTTFDGDGIYLHDLTGGNDFASKVIPQSDNSFLISGTTNGGANIFVMKFTSGLILDNTFDSDGVIVTNLNGASTETAGGIALQTDGKILVSGYTNAGGTTDFFVARYTTAGVLDVTFNTVGYGTANFGGADFGDEIVVNSNDDMFVNGYTNSGGTIDFGVAKFLWLNTPTVTTTSAVTQSESSILVSGNITSVDGENASFRGVVYDVQANPDPDVSDNSSTVTGSFGTGVFNRTITGLDPETEYKFRAFATNSAGSGYGAVISRRTYSAEPSSHSSTFYGDALTLTSVTVNFDAANTITDCDGYIIIYNAHVYPTVTPTDGTQYTSGAYLGDGIIGAIITNTASTSAVISGMTAGSQYYFRIYPFNWDGANTDTYNYRIQATVPQVVISIGIPTFSAFSATDIDSSTIAVSYTIIKDGGATITETGTVWNITGNPTIADNADSLGAEIGTGSGTVYGVTPGRTIYIRAYARNSFGYAYSDIVEISSLDADGVSDEIEANAPNSGDGNGDGIADARQPFVTSIEFDDNYLTLHSLQEFDILDVQFEPIEERSAYTFPYGATRFQINNASATVKIYYHGVSNLDGFVYRKLNKLGTWYNFENAVFGSELVNGVRVATVTLSLVDGGPEDIGEDGDGIIIDPGGPAFLLSSSIQIPTMTDYARYAALLLLLSISLWWIRKS